MDKEKNEIIIFENQDVKLKVNMKDETVWLSLDQMAELFERDKSVISINGDAECFKKHPRPNILHIHIILNN